MANIQNNIDGPEFSSTEIIAEENRHALIHEKMQVIPPSNNNTIFISQSYDVPT